MDYKDFDLQDFLQDEYFVGWILDPGVESSHFWEQWLTANPGKRETVRQAREIISSLTYKKKDALDDKEYSEVLEHLLKVNQQKNSQGFRWKAKYTLRLAASVAIFCILYTYVRQAAVNESPTKDFRAVLVETKMGQKKTLSLPDGTSVILNSGSTIEYRIPFEKNTRTVSLTGEAFFDVAHNEKKPFIIETTGLLAKVLGTSFNIRGYADDPFVSVAVLSGRVQLSAEGSTDRILAPNEMGIYDGSSNRIALSSFDPGEIDGWTRGILSFDQQSLGDVFKELERWYGVTIEIKSGVRLEGRYSGRYSNASLDHVLRGISYTSHFDYEINNKQVSIYESQE